MSLIRQLRRQANVTQQDLAARAGTSQPTIAAYEAGAKSPTLKTVQKLAAALNLDLLATFVPRMTRQERRSLAYHRAIARALSDNPQATLEQADRNLRTLRKLHPHAIAIFNRWEAWLALPIHELASRIVDPGETAREMRHVSPFSGLLTAKQRTQILMELRSEDYL